MVKAYAELTIRSHYTALITLRPFFHVNDIISKPREILNSLSSVANPKEFDIRFMESQVLFHSIALGLVQDILIPYIWSQPFKQVLVNDVVPLIANHLNRAKEILEMLLDEKQS